ncbi:MAG: DUF58 domain-containing protein [Armatimonadota bacterium]
MIFTWKLPILFLIAGVLALFSGKHTIFAILSSLVLSVSIVLFIYDYFEIKKTPKIIIERKSESKLSLGADNPVHLKIRNPSEKSIYIILRDEYPEGFITEKNVFEFLIPPKTTLSHTYYIMPTKRGDYSFGNTYIKIRSLLGFLYIINKYDTSRDVQVYPNLLGMKKYEQMVLKEKNINQGYKVMRIKGQGTEFESLREYQQDDSFKAIDWKATARRGKTVTRVYQEEKSQNIFLCLDTGRLMGSVIEGLTKLDHSINAAMMLAHVANIKGDKTGLMAFNDNIDVFCMPKSGKSQLLNLLKITYNIKEVDIDSDYDKAIGYFRKRLTRRSLVVIFTDLIDSVSSKPLISQVAQLSRKHICLCVTMSDPAVIDSAYSNIKSVSDAYMSASARQVLKARKMAAAKLTQAGAIVIDTMPKEFTPSVVKEYLKLKSTARL